MASHCAICNKAKVTGNSVSHASNKTKRAFRPNLQRVHAIVNGSRKKIRVCTVCIKSGKVQKAV
ncbi:MAG: 50S ribosomal protein L28 [Nitrospiria bacterium]